MKSILPLKVALIGMAVLIVLFAAIHALILFQVIPFDMVWGGKMKTVKEMRLFEGISLVVSLLLLSIVLMRAGWLRLKIPAKRLKIAFWILFGLFLLNTLGNLASENTFEQMAFTPVTLILAIFSLRVALE
jgi:hypothetical protein